MIKYLSLIVLVIFLVSCENESPLVGSWIEVNSKNETVQFHEDGKMEFKQKGETGQSPINFKYEIIDSKEGYILFNLFVYNDTTFIKKAKHKATFEDENTITIENLDFPDVKSDTYSRKQ